MLQHVTTACHHCLEPACLNGCPVDAYEKDPVTGIVKHLDDQCIGCQYCTLTCPYDVPKFNAGKGIVRKCDMCSDRLAAGEAPGVRAGVPDTRRSGSGRRRARRSSRTREADAFLPGRARARATRCRRPSTGRAKRCRATCCRPTIYAVSPSTPTCRWSSCWC